MPSATLELVHLRASQINGCSFCVDSGARSAKQAGETDERLFAVAAWRETHPKGLTKNWVSIERGGVVYELFLTNLPQQAFTAADVVALYLHRGAFEAALADEDQEQDPDRWCSHAPCGQECWQIVSQWVWNLRLETGASACACSPAHH